MRFFIETRRMGELAFHRRGIQVGRSAYHAKALARKLLKLGRSVQIRALQGTYAKDSL